MAGLLSWVVRRTIEPKHLNLDAEAFRSENNSSHTERTQMFGLGRSSGKIRFDGYYHSYRSSQTYCDQNSRIGVLIEAIDVLRFYPSGKVISDQTVSGNPNTGANLLDINHEGVIDLIGTYYLTRSDQISARLGYSLSGDSYGYQTYEGYIARDGELVVDWRSVVYRYDQNVYLPERCFAFASYRWSYKN